MTDSKVARRYAKSLFDLAIERNQLEQIYQDVLRIDLTVAHNRELGVMLKSPLVHNYKKNAILKEIFGSSIQTMTTEFLRIITAKGRESYIPAITKQFIHIYKESKGIRTVYVTTATPLDADTKANVIQMLMQNKGGTVELVEKVNPEIIGGIIIREEDDQIDSSIVNSLHRMRASFHAKEYIKAI